MSSPFSKFWNCQYVPVQEHVLLFPPTEMPEAVTVIVSSQIAAGSPENAQEGPYWIRDGTIVEH